MARIIKKVIQKRLNTKGDKQYIFDSSSAKEIKKTKLPILNRKVENRKIENIKRTKRFSLSDEPIANNTKDNRFKNRVNKSVTPHTKKILPQPDSILGGRFEHRMKSSVIDGLIKKPKDIIKKLNLNYEINDLGEYVKQENVDYDVVICISSYNRYRKVKRIIKQLLNQKTKYTFKIFLINDGSTIYKKYYEHLPKKFPEIIYLENEINGGKKNYWKTLNTLWGETQKYKTHALCQIDDDFSLCENFLDRLLDLYYKKKKENNRYFAISYHLNDMNDYKKIRWKLSNWVDGGTIFDIEFIKIINYEINKINAIRWKINENLSSGVWEQISINIETIGCLVYKPRYSLALHNGNEDSKLNPNTRKIRKINTKNFIDE